MTEHRILCGNVATCPALFILVSTCPTACRDLPRPCPDPPKSSFVKNTKTEAFFKKQKRWFDRKLLKESYNPRIIKICL